MRRAVFGLTGLLSVALAIAPTALRGATSQATLPPPGFHHLHLNSLNPEAAIAFYIDHFPATSRAMFAGQPALRSPNDVWILFTKVEAPPATQPPTAFWHFGWHVTDVRASLARYRQRGVTLLPLYTGDAGRTVFVSSDTWPAPGAALGLTLAEIADAKAKKVTPLGGAGFAYLRGPDDAVVEYQGNMPSERFNHIHMFQDQPYCAQVWYETHLKVAPVAGIGAAPRTIANCRIERGTDRTFPALESEGMYRTGRVTTTTFGDVSFYWYINQTGRPPLSTRGQVMDHVALSVSDLDGWIDELRSAGVVFLEPPYSVGDLRAVMIEGPSREAIELVELK
jgi:catechol 2,3-dioxygenase-like lactoylglutathione lyase family enzyme